MATELEGEVVSPLARFCPVTRRLIIIVTILLVGQMGSVFALLMKHQEESNPALGAVDLLPVALTIGACVLSSFAYRAERRVIASESDSAKSLLMVEIGIFVFLLIFFFFILLVS